MGCFKRRIAGYERNCGARVGDNGSTSYVATHADDYFTCLVPERFLGSSTVVVRSRGARIIGNLQKRKGKRESSTTKGQAFTLGMRDEY